MYSLTDLFNLSGLVPLEESDREILYICRKPISGEIDVNDMPSNWENSTLRAYLNKIWLMSFPKLKDICTPFFRDVTSGNPETLFDLDYLQDKVSILTKDEYEKYSSILHKNNIMEDDSWLLPVTSEDDRFTSVCRGVYYAHKQTDELDVFPIIKLQKQYI